MPSSDRKLVSKSPKKYNMNASFVILIFGISVLFTSIGVTAFLSYIFTRERAKR